MSSVDLAQIADELYSLPPNVFTAARDERVAQARNAGDRVLATQLAALKRPTVGAWLVNLVALRRPEAVQRLLAAAEAIRAATGAAELRELSQRRRQEIDAVLAAARELAANAGAPPPTSQQLAEAESTLTAAMADAQAAVVVSSGRVLKALSYGGFGGLGDLGGEVVPAAAPPPPSRTRSERSARDDELVAARAAARASAGARVAEADRALAAAETAEQAAVRSTQEIAGKIDALQQRLEEAERASRAARQARQAAERDLASAKRRLDRTS